jgi:hypothetical protein
MTRRKSAQEMSMKRRKMIVKEVLEEVARIVWNGKSDWSRIADLFIMFVDEYPKTETAKTFRDFLVYQAPEWLDDTPWDDFFGVLRKDRILEFIQGWVDEKDIPAFMEYIKKNDEELYGFLTDPEIPDDVYY